LQILLVVEPGIEAWVAYFDAHTVADVQVMPETSVQDSDILAVAEAVPAAVELEQALVKLDLWEAVQQAE
jgi:hypothetical protein